jgi:hypothetical protein
VQATPPSLAVRLAFRLRVRREPHALHTVRSAHLVAPAPARSARQRGA